MIIPRRVASRIRLGNYALMRQQEELANSLPDDYELRRFSQFAQDTGFQSPITDASMMQLLYGWNVATRDLDGLGHYAGMGSIIDTFNSGVSTVGGTIDNTMCSWGYGAFCTFKPPVPAPAPGAPDSALQAPYVVTNEDVLDKLREQYSDWRETAIPDPAPEAPKTQLQTLLILGGLVFVVGAVLGRR